MNIKDSARCNEELEKVKEKYCSLIDNSPDGIVIVYDGRVVFINNRGLNMLGYTRDELIGKEVFQYIHPEDREMVKNNIEKVLSGISVPPTEYRLINKSGEIIYVETSRKKVEYEGMPAVQCIVRDISERKRLDKAIKELEDRYRNLIEYSPDAIGVIYNGRIVFCNNKTIELLGYTYDEINGKGSVELISPEDRERASKNIMSVLSGATLPAPREYKFIKKNGEYIDVELTSSRIIYGGKPAIQGVIRDVSERKKRDAKIREMEERYRNLVEDSPDGITIICEGRTVFVNKKCAEMFGYTTDELIGKNPVEMIPHEDREKMIKNVRAILSGESLPSPREYRIIRKNGDVAEVEAASSRILYEGKPAIQSIFRDITERKRREKELKEMEERYRSIVDNSPDGIGVSCDGRIVFANNKLLELHGYTMDELYGKSPFELIFPADRERAVENVRAILSGAALPSPREYRILRKNGEVVEVEATSSRIIYVGKLAIQSILRDITERKMKDKKLKEIEERYRTLVENSPDAIGAVCNGRIIFINGKGLEMFGYTRDEIMGMDVAKTVSPEDRGMVLNDIKIVLSDGHIPPKEYKLLKKNGEVFNVEITRSKIEYEGKPAIQSTIRDISERKKRDNEMRKYIRELEILNKVSIDRELRMIELKKEVNNLLTELGREKMYKITE